MITQDQIKNGIVFQHNNTEIAIFEYGYMPENESLWQVYQIYSSHKIRPMGMLVNPKNSSNCIEPFGLTAEDLLEWLNKFGYREIGKLTLDRHN